MGTPITNLSFRLYRNDKGYDAGKIQEEFFDVDANFDGVDDNGIYTFSKKFTASQDSSFGLEGAENAFRVGIYAKDAANEGVNLTLDSLNELLAEQASIDDFSMKVRVKEKTVPVVIPDTSVWGNYHNNTHFTATFVAYDQNNNNRMAGIDKEKTHMTITLDGVAQDSNLITVTPISNEGYPTVGQENGEVYQITYPFNFSDEGTYLIGLTVKDNDENSFTASKSITIQTSVPLITLTSPGENEIYGYGKDFVVKGTVNMPSKIYITILERDTNGEFTIKTDFDNTLLGTTQSPNDVFEKKYDLPDGYYKIIVKAVDVNFDKSFSQEERIFVKDTLAPRFLSVKFYPLDANDEISGPATNTFSSGSNYKIVIEVE